jgi:hypothetical protein
MSRSLRVRWRAAPPDPHPIDDGLPPGCEFVVEREEARALAHRDAIDVLVDGRPGPLLAGARLAHVIVPWAGFPPSLREALLERPRLKAYNAHDNAPLVAQHALARTDALLVSLPASPATVGLIDREALARMWPDAQVVNVGRGTVIDEDALFDALATGRLAGAGLDVWWRYPDGPEAQAATPPATRPFWELPNVVLSPRRAEATEASEHARVADVCATLWAIAEGRERSRVDVEAGY